jgi:hypothetical protein
MPDRQEDQGGGKAEDYVQQHVKHGTRAPFKDRSDEEGLRLRSVTC